MTFLLPAEDGVADEVARRLPQATIARYEDGGYDLDEVDFYCLPYMGNGASIAILAVSLILASLRQLPRVALDQARHRWQHVRTDSLDGKKVLLVGYGGMGKAIEERLVPFGARITRCSRTARDGVAPLSQLP